MAGHGLGPGANIGLAGPFGGLNVTSQEREREFFFLSGCCLSLALHVAVLSLLYPHYGGVGLVYRPLVGLVGLVTNFALRYVYAAKQAGKGRAGNEARTRLPGW